MCIRDRFGSNADAATAEFIESNPDASFVVFPIAGRTVSVSVGYRIEKYWDFSKEPWFSITLFTSEFWHFFIEKSTQKLVALRRNTMQLPLPTWVGQARLIVIKNINRDFRVIYFKLQ